MSRPVDMLHALTRGAIAAAVVLVLAGCASTSGIPYPSLPRLPGTGDSAEAPTMTPAEQKGAIDDLTSAQASNAAAASGATKAPAKSAEPAPVPPLEVPPVEAPLPE